MGGKLQYTKEAGIYKLTCNINGKIYIGKGIHINKRINRHKNTKNEKNATGYLHRAIRKYGWDSFEVEILEIVENFNKLKDNNLLLEREAYYISIFDTSNENKGYNICKFSTDRTGVAMLEETKDKIRKANTGNPKLISANLGKTLSQETKDKISQSNLGKKKSKEHSENISKGKKGKPSKLKGITLSEKAKEKLRQAWVVRRLNK